MKVQFKTLRAKFLAVICLLVALVFFQNCSTKSSETGGTRTTALDSTVVINAGATDGALAPLWRDHYDLSITHLNYLGDPAFTSIMTQKLKPRYWRASVGRWEVGIPAPTNANSHDINILKTVEREFYRGPNTLAGADDANNYDFTYLDNQLNAIIATGAVPYLCFDYMPATLSAEQNPNNAQDFGGASQYSFSNGIRTSKPADNAVYAKVVLNTIRHVRGLFKGTTNFGVTHFEIGNEPDLPLVENKHIFWTGTHVEFFVMYWAIANAVAADAVAAQIKLGAGSFSLLPSPGIDRYQFLDVFLQGVKDHNPRLDFVAYHVYDDLLSEHEAILSQLPARLSALPSPVELYNAEWGRNLSDLDSVFDSIEHGLFRARVMTMMQKYGVKMAHEALIRDPYSPHLAAGQIGLVFAPNTSTGDPAKIKAGGEVYAALNKLNDTLISLPKTIVNDEFVFAGKNVGNTKVVVAMMVDPTSRPVNETLQVDNLPWGAATYTVKQYTLSNSTLNAGEGLKLARTLNNKQGPLTDVVSYGPDASHGQLLIWEITKN